MALDFLFQGNPPPSVTSTTTSMTSMPDWYQDYMRGLFGRANAIAGEPYQAYGGPRLADFTPDQIAAFEKTRATGGAYEPAMAGAMEAAQRGSAPWSAATREQFMSPYIGGVVEEIARLGNQNFQENILDSLNSNFVGSGSFGSSRNMEMANRAARDAQREILGQQSLALQRGVEAAGTEYGGWADRALAGSRQLGALGGLEQQYGYTDAAAQEAIGQTQQNLSQQNLNLGYQDFLEQRDWPRTTVDWMSSVQRGFSPPTSTASTSTAPYQGYMGPSPLMQLAGTYGMGRSLGIFRRGGKVRMPHGGRVRYARGGRAMMLPRGGLAYYGRAS
jgi:hypothetical protein